MPIKIAKVQVDPNEALEQGRRQDRTRDETQTALDGEVGAIAAAWRELPDNTPVAARPRLRFAVDPTERSEFKGMVRRAGNLHKVGIEFFKDSVDAKGRAVVTFTVGPKPPKSH